MYSWWDCSGGRDAGASACHRFCGPLQRSCLGERSRHRSSPASLPCLWLALHKAGGSSKPDMQPSRHCCCIWENAPAGQRAAAAAGVEPRPIWRRCRRLKALSRRGGGTALQLAVGRQRHGSRPTGAAQLGGGRRADCGWRESKAGQDVWATPASLALPSQHSLLSTSGPHHRRARAAAAQRRHAASGLQARCSPA